MNFYVPTVHVQWPNTQSCKHFCRRSHSLAPPGTNLFHYTNAALTTANHKNNSRLVTEQRYSSYTTVIIWKMYDSFCFSIARSITFPVQQPFDFHYILSFLSRFLCILSIFDVSFFLPFYNFFFNLRTIFTSIFDCFDGDYTLRGKTIKFISFSTKRDQLNQTIINQHISCEGEIFGLFYLVISTNFFIMMLNYLWWREEQWMKVLSHCFHSVLLRLFYCPNNRFQWHASHSSSEVLLPAIQLWSEVECTLFSAIELKTFHSKRFVPQILFHSLSYHRINKYILSNVCFVCYVCLPQLWWRQN